MVDTAVAAIDALTDQITPLRAQLQAIGRSQSGARELAGHYGIGSLTVWQELSEDLLRRFQTEGLIPQEADVSQLATGLLAAVQGGYRLAQTSRDVTPMAAAIDMALAHLHRLNRRGDASQRPLTDEHG
jgi:hypothetical protein